MKGLLNFEFSILFSYLFGERVPVKEIEIRIRTWVYLYIFLWGGKRLRKKDLNLNSISNNCLLHFVWECRCEKLYKVFLLEIRIVELVIRSVRHA